MKFLNINKMTQNKRYQGKDKDRGIKFVSNGKECLVDGIIKGIEHLLHQRNTF